jgi:hypothetical protein
MISRLLIPTLLVLPLCAQVPAPAPAVRILLQADKPPIGTPALDMTAISEKLEAFAKAENLVNPGPDGDGWVLGIGLTPQEEPNGLLVGAGAIRLSRLSGGKIAPDGVKENGALVVARKSGDLCSALGYELVRRCEELLVEARVIPGKSLSPEPLTPTTTPKVGQGDSAQPRRFEFSQIKVRELPPQPPYPAYAKTNRIQGRVVVDLVVGPDGIPISVAALEGPGPLLPYACRWALGWRFDPLTPNGQPEYGRFKLNLNFRLMN